MFEFFAVLAGGLALWNGLTALRRRRDHGRRVLRPWVEAAAQCGLRVRESSGFWPLAIRAEGGGVQVSIENFHSDPIEMRARIVVTFPGPLSLDGLQLRRESPESRGRSRDLAIGDQAFDTTFVVEGPAPLVR